MKADIHPKYFEKATVSCSCGSKIVLGSTVESLKTELCSHCHPFYTGTQKLVDTAGRVDKFEARRKAGELHKQAVVEHERLKKVKKAQAFEEKKKPAAKKKAKSKK